MIEEIKNIHIAAADLWLLHYLYLKFKPILDVKFFDFYVVLHFYYHYINTSLTCFHIFIIKLNWYYTWYLPIITDLIQYLTFCSILPDVKKKFIEGIGHCTFLLPYWQFVDTMPLEMFVFWSKSDTQFSTSAKVLLSQCVSYWWKHILIEKDKVWWIRRVGWQLPAKCFNCILNRFSFVCTCIVA